MTPLDPLGEQLERTVPAAERHGRGQYFTPDPLVRFVLDLVDEPGGTPRSVLDPSCGSGRFLLGAGERWSLEGPALRGFDTDPAALGAASTQLPGAQLSARDFLEVPVSEPVDLVVGNPPYVRRRGKKRDLYVDFIERSLDHLEDGGRLGLVLSNAWLSVGYGREVQRLLLERCAVEWIVESTVESWFEGASVNTMVLVARRCTDAAERARNEVVFAEVREPLPARPREVRRVVQDELSGFRAWAPLLRAPEEYLELCRSAATTPLGTLADLRRGYTTNDNGFFYPPPEARIESRYLAPLLKGPRDAPGLRLRADEMASRVFLCDVDRAQLEAAGARGALRWIRQHRRGQGKAGWKLRPQEPARLFLVKGYHDRFRQPLADRPIQADQQIYLVHPKEGRDEVLLAALLNSSWCHLSLELTGRVNFGDGVLWLGLEDARASLMLPSLAGLDGERAQRLRSAYEALPPGPVPSVFELQSSPQWRKARAALDAEVAALLGLDEERYGTLAAWGVELCRRRLALAASRRSG